MEILPLPILSSVYNSIMRFFAEVCLFLFLTVLITACQKEVVFTSNETTLQQIDVPAGFPAIIHPSGNEFTPERWALGKALFYDTALSIDSTVSCASCHKLSHGFADQTPASPGVFGRPGTRNAPTLANVAYHPYFLREGGVPTLEMQVLVPISEHNEFGFNLVKITERLATNQHYQAKAQAGYGRPLDAYVITRAISLFERSLISGNSRYDQFLHGEADALNALEKEGMNLFFSSKTNCSACHSGQLFTNFAFENNGIHEKYIDNGRFRLTGKQEDLHLFKTPSLRNAGLTAPYMHDGSISTLEEVVEHYSKGGKGHWQQSAMIQPLHLSAGEKNALVSFIRSLTDEQFVSNPFYQK